MAGMIELEPLGEMLVVKRGPRVAAQPYHSEIDVVILLGASGRRKDASEVAAERNELGLGGKVQVVMTALVQYMRGRDEKSNGTNSQHDRGSNSLRLPASIRSVDRSGDMEEPSGQGVGPCGNLSSDLTAGCDVV